MPKRPIELGGLFNSLAENKIPDGRCFSMSNASVDDKNFKCGKRYISIGSRPSANIADVCYGLGYGKFTCNETQSLTVTGGPTGGTVVLTWVNDTATIAYNATAADVQAALVALTNVEDGEITCAGGPWPLEPIYASWKGRYGGATQTLISLKTNSLSGGSTPTVAIARFVTGGAVEAYFVVVQPSGTGSCTLYKVTSSDGFETTTWTSVATGLTAGDWFFQQYADKVYASNVTDGLLYYQLGGAWSGAAGIASIQNPVAPPTSAQARTDATNAINLTSATFGNFTGWGSNPTVANETTNRSVKVTLAAALAGDVVSMDITLNADQDDSHQDYWVLSTFPNSNAEIQILPGNMLLELINDDGSPLTLDPVFLGQGIDVSNGTNSNWQRGFHYGSDRRNKRDNILKIRLTWTVQLGTSAKFFHFQIFRIDSWPNDRMVTLNVDAGATNKAIEYAYSYLKASTLEESKLSPSAFSPAVPGTNLYAGGYVIVTCTGSTQLTTSDYIKVYRKDRFGQWRFIGSMANVTSGTTTFSDRNMLDEIEGYQTTGQITLPGGFLPEFITRWKQCLAVAADRKLWLSYVGNPFIFAPDPDDFSAQSTLDTTDPNIPRTVFMSDTRSEDVIGIVGQDSLYLAGPSTGYAMTSGDRPNELSPPRPLPEDRGCLGYRAASRLSGGALFAFFDGLWYDSVSAGFTGIVQSGTIVQEEITKEVRGTWSDIFGTSPSNAIVAVYKGEIYCVSGTRYIKFTRNKQIESGTFADSMKAVYQNTPNGFVWASATGELMKFGDYVTDAGTDVAFSYTTGIIEGARSRITGIEVQYTGQPAVLLECWDGRAGYASQRFDMEPLSPDGSPTISYDTLGIAIQGVRFRVTLYGTGADTIESLSVEFEEAKGGQGN